MAIKAVSFYMIQIKTLNIFNIENAKERIAPNSTYKIYDALLGLESGIITPEDSDMTQWRRLSIRCMGSQSDLIFCHEKLCELVLSIH